MGFILRPVAATLVQGLVRQYENGVNHEGDVEAGDVWLALRQQTAYMPEPQALPWEYVFARNSTHKQHEDSLKLHAEKKALAVLLAYSEAMLNVAIEFNACVDCHSFFKTSSLLSGRGIQLRQPKMVHVFTDGSCSCNDQWRWEARLTPPVHS